MSDRDPTGVSDRDPLNPPRESPSQPSAAAVSVLSALPQPWNLGGKEARNLLPAIETALASGWTTKKLAAYLSRNPDGIRYPARVLAWRLVDLPDAAPSNHPLPAWCGECEDERSRTITIALPDGTEAAAFCPQCSPQAQRRAPTSDTNSLDGMEVNKVGGQRV